LFQIEKSATNASSVASRTISNIEDQEWSPDPIRVGIDNDEPKQRSGI
jgi:hypothetical protein